MANAGHMGLGPLLPLMPGATNPYIRLRRARNQTEKTKGGTARNVCRLLGPLANTQYSRFPRTDIKLNVGQCRPASP